MFKLHLTQKGQATFPKLLRECLGVNPGDDVVVEIIDGYAVLRPHESGAGLLSRYAPPTHGRTFQESVGKYLGALDEKTHSHS